MTSTLFSMRSNHRLQGYANVFCEIAAGFVSQSAPHQRVGNRRWIFIQLGWQKFIHCNTRAKSFAREVWTRIARRVGSFPHGKKFKGAYPTRCISAGYAA
jgi:hypothetical protein